MTTYFDTSALVPLYVEETASERVSRFVLEQQPVIFLNELQELEFRNAVRQKLFRQEISEGEVASSFRLLADDLVFGNVRQKSLVWSSVFHDAESLSNRLGKSQTCRTFDLLHISIARVSDVRSFATLDAGQAALAEAAGLKVVTFS